MGYQEIDFDNHISQIINLIHPEDKKKLKNDINKMINGDTDYIRDEYRVKTKKGKWKWIKILGKVTKRKTNDEARRAVGVHIDIDQKKRQEEKIKYLSFHDDLTGL